ncbi:MAG: ferritin [Synergistes sp.]|nr:ferritin [Synergistes sp.]
MVIDPKMEKAINGQIRAELESAYLYLSMASWFDANDLGGCAHWMKKQFEEEQEHAMKLYEYVVTRGGRVILEAIAEPKHEWKSATEIFEQTLAHEQLVTSLIYGLVELAEELKDHATREMLSWFVKEQVEEEEHAMEILAKFKRVGEVPISLVMLDKELAAR